LRGDRQSCAGGDIEVEGSSEVEVAPTSESPVRSSRAAHDDSPAWSRLETQIAWYSKKSRYNQRWFKALKVVQIVIAAVIPVAAAADVGSAWIGAGGAVIVALEGLQQLQQYQQNWAAYRSTAERLKHEKFLFLSEAGPYASVERPEALLAERVEGLVSQEHAAWVSQQSEKQAPPAAAA
jgi:hypothetical protein